MTDSLLEMNDHKYFISVASETFTPEECEEIIKQGLSKPLGEGGIMGYGTVSESRKCKTRFFEWDELDWMQERCFKAIMDINSAARYEVTGFEEKFKFVQYDTGDHFKLWHVDSGVGYASRRKISMTVQLSDPKDYDGGILQFNPDCDGCAKNFELSQKPRGTAIVFPSFAHHCVTPITRGTRYALVNWISGPPLR